MNQILYDDFLKVALRAGKIIAVEPFARARKPAHKIKADFEPTIGVLQTSA